MMFLLFVGRGGGGGGGGGAGFGGDDEHKRCRNATEASRTAGTSPSFARIFSKAAASTHQGSAAHSKSASVARAANKLDKPDTPSMAFTDDAAFARRGNIFQTCTRITQI